MSAVADPPSVLPYRDLAAWRRDQQRLVLLMLEGFALWDREMGPLGDLRDVATMVRDPSKLRALMQRVAGPTRSTEDITGAIDDLRAVIDARTAALSPRPPLAALAERLELDDAEVDVMRTLWVLQSSPVADRIARAVWLDLAVGPPTTDLLLALLGRREHRRAAVLRVLTPTSRLCRLGLLTVADTNHTRWPRVMLPDSVLGYLGGQRPRLAAPFRWASPLPETIEPELLMTDAVWRRLSAPLAGHQPRVMLTSPEGAGHEAALAAMARRAGRDCVLCNLTGLVRARERGRDPLADGLRDVVVAGAWLVIETPSTWPPEASAYLIDVADRLSALPEVVVLRSENVSPLTRHLARSAKVVGWEPLELPALVKLWQACGPATGGDVGAGEARAPSEAALSKLLNHYEMNAEAIMRAAPDAARRASERGATEIEHVDLAHAAQEQLDLGFSGLATRVTTNFKFEDLILPEETSTQVEEILLSCKHRDRVMVDWGFDEKVPYGAGVTMLFAGPSGTGKTMAASILAQELDQPLYRVDLSQIFDRYVGETEKNLARIFEAARTGHAIILFDEADALFSKRTNVSSANDRYANLEVNYLLQRIEQHRGIVILTTNLDSSIDDAFRRRIRFTIRFPEPDEATREILWRSMIPASAQVADDIGWERVAKMFELPGGAIKNAVLRAAFLAVGDGTAITTDHLERAGRAECAALGKLVRHVSTPLYE